MGLYENYCRSGDKRHRDYRRLQENKPFERIPKAYKWVVKEDYDEYFKTYFPKAHLEPVHSIFKRTKSIIVTLEFNEETEEMFLCSDDGATDHHFYDMSEEGILNAFKTIVEDLFIVDIAPVYRFIKKVRDAEESLHVQGYSFSDERKYDSGWRLTTNKGRLGLDFPVLKNTNRPVELSVDVQFTENGSLASFSDNSYVKIIASRSTFDYKSWPFDNDLDDINNFFDYAIPENLLEKFQEAVFELEHEIREYMKMKKYELPGENS